tara:strand:- start:2454 stop:2642 length:189 start_codon:yes stop_codon:yes gene_type:complete
MRFNKYLIFLIVFIYIDLSVELKLILDNFTFSAVYFAFIKHPLAFFMIFSLPFLSRELKGHK